jgi:hypothetical protein
MEMILDFHHLYVLLTPDNALHQTYLGVGELRRWAAEKIIIIDGSISTKRNPIPIK